MFPGYWVAYIFDASNSAFRTDRHLNSVQSITVPQDGTASATPVPVDDSV